MPLERRPRDRKEIIVPGDGGKPPTRLDRSLVLAVARGRAWVKALRQGEDADTAEIASKYDLGEAYVRRILRLAFLAVAGGGNPYRTWRRNGRAGASR